MSAVVTHRLIVERLERAWGRETIQLAAAGTATLTSPTAKPIPLTKLERSGVWVWIALLGPAVAYELLAFTDGAEGQPTLSQVVKGLCRSAGRAGALALTLALAGAAVALFLHWVVELF